MQKPTLLILIFIGSCFGLQKRQSEYDDFNKARRNARLETLLSTLKLISAAETPELKIEEEELPDSPEQRKLSWLEDEVRFGDFPLGTIRQIEQNAPGAVVVPAVKDTLLQVARHGPHAFVTNDEVIDSPLKFISHHHPSLRTVDLSELANEVSLIFAHPHHHQLPETLVVSPEDNSIVKLLGDLKKQRDMEGWQFFEEGRERSAQFDPPQGVNASANPFHSTILVLPDNNPVKKYLKELQDKMKMREQQQSQGNQTAETQTQQQVNQTQEEDNFQERSATFIPAQQQFLSPTTSSNNHQPVQDTAFVNQPFFRDNGNSEQVGKFQEAQQRNAQFDPPSGVNASVNPFESTVLVLPDDSPVKKHLKELQDKIKMRQQQQSQGNQTTETLQQVNQTQERSATLHGNQGLFIPTHQQFLQPATSFVNHQPVHGHPITQGFGQFPHQHTTFVNQPFFRDSEQESKGVSDEVGAAEPTHLHKHLHKKFGPKVIPQNIIHIHQQQSAQSYQNPGYQRVATPFIVDIPARQDEFRRERSKRSPTISRPGSFFFQQQHQQPSFINQPFLVPQSSGFGQQSVFQQPSGFAVVPTNSFFRRGQEVEEPDPFLRSPEGDHPDFDVPIQQNSSVVNKPLTAEDIERIETTIPKVFPQPGGYFPIIQGTSPNGFPLQKPSDDPGYADLERIRPVNITALEEDYFNKTDIDKDDDVIPVDNEDRTFPLFLSSCAIPVFQAISPDGAPLTKPMDDPFYSCLNKTKGRFHPSNHSIQECIGYKTKICPPPEEPSKPQQDTTANLRSLHFIDFDEAASGARSAQIDLEEVVGPLSIFEFSNQDNNDDISVVELEEVFPNEMRAADAQPTHLHHHGSHFFLHQHGFVPNQQCQGAVVTPTQQAGGHIPYLDAKINAGFDLVHQLTPSQSQSVQISGNGNGVSQSQAVVQTDSGHSIRGGQNVHIAGEGNSVSQSQSQTGAVSNQNSQIHGTGNSVALSQSVHRIRRSLVELVNDPNVKLDVPKTISNIGTVAKTSFHDQKKPMYHLNNMVGSIKDVIMSTIKIPPQGLIVPSQYRIVNAAELDDNNLEAKHEITRSINQDLLSDGVEVHNFNQEQNSDLLGNTFNRFGSAIRQSIQAGQQTLAHVGDIAHSARQVVHTAKSAAPQMFLPRNQKRPDKVMLVTPKLLQIKTAEEADQHLLQAQNTKDFVKMGDLMDALSVSNPNEENLGVEKIIIERKGANRKPIIVGRSRDIEESNLKEFVSRMKGEFDTLLKEKLKQERDEKRLTKTIRKLERKSDNVRAPLAKLAKKPTKFESVLGGVQNHADIMKTKSDQIIETIQDVNGKFIDSIRTIGGSKATPKDDVVGVTHIIIPKNFLTTPKPTARLKSTNGEPEDWDKQVSSFLTDLFEGKTPEGGEETVGAPQFSRNGLNLSPELMKPFMGRASKASLRRFMKQHGNKVVEEEGVDEVVGAAQTSNSSMDQMQMEKVRQAQKVLGAVNPLMFEKLFNETMSGSDGKSLSPFEVFTAGRNGTEEEQICYDPTKVGTSMKITRELLKPFMGRLKGNEYMKVIPVQDGGDEEESGQEYYMEE